MNPSARKFPWTIAIGLLLLFLTLALAFLLAELKARVVQSRALRVIGPVGDFALTNQNGRAVSLADLRGHVWVADIIFTTCAGPCLGMTRKMKELETALPPRGQARLVSLTTNPDYDTPPVLKQYAEKVEADANRWDFLTGPKAEIMRLAMGGLKLSVEEVDPAKRESVNDLFVHSTIFVVVDKQGRLRGAFQTGGEGVDWATEKARILVAVRALERER